METPIQPNRLKHGVLCAVVVVGAIAACGTTDPVAGRARIADAGDAATPSTAAVIAVATPADVPVSSPAGLPTTTPAPRLPAATLDWMPTPGQVIAAAGATRTCHQGRGPGVPRTAEQCLRWTVSGPVNVVLVGRGSDPVVLLARVWQPAGGNWLVAEANLVAPGCHGWTASQKQFQLGLSSVSRRHVKLVPADCAFPGLHAQVADAHTDLYDRKHCAGDHMVDMRAAREALVASMKRLPGVRVTYVQVRPQQRYPGGCDVTVVDDGRVAVIAVP